MTNEKGRVRTRRHNVDVEGSSESRHMGRREVEEPYRSRGQIDRMPAQSGFIRVGGSVTRNQGNFNSAKVTIEVEIPCVPSPEGIEDAYQGLTEIVNDLIDREYEAATGDAIGEEDGEDD